MLLTATGSMKGWTDSKRGRLGHAEKQPTTAGDGRDFKLTAYKSNVAFPDVLFLALKTLNIKKLVATT